MDCINQVWLCGRLGKDAETKFYKGNVALTRFDVAIASNYRAVDSGEWEERLEWFHCKLWRNAGLGELLKKGCAVSVLGHLENRKVTSLEGVTRTYVDIVVDRCVLVGDPAKWSPIDEIGLQGKPEPRLVKGLTPEVVDEKLPF